LGLFSLGAQLPLYLATDTLSNIFAIFVAFIFLIVSIFCQDYLTHEERPEHFVMFYLLALGMLLGLSYAGNLLTLYLFFELLTLVSVPLVLHSQSLEAVAAAFKYLYYSIAGASLGLLGLFVFYTNSWNLDFVPGGNLPPQAGENSPLLLVASMAVIIGFSAKAGLFPLHAWLPAAHPVAPAPASAILSGVITKAGVFAVIRYTLYLVGGDFLRGTWVQGVWLALTLFTILLGSLQAYRELLLKKRLAYSSISQVSYILFGIATLSPLGLVGALFHMFLHGVAKNGLFLNIGAITSASQKSAADELQGLGRNMPFTFGALALLSLCLVGIPPSGGFTSKWYLATAALAALPKAISWCGPLVLIASALLTAGYLFPLLVEAFFPGTEWVKENEVKEAPPLLLAPTMLLALLGVALGLFASPLLDALQLLAASLF